MKRKKGEGERSLTAWIPGRAWISSWQCVENKTAVFMRLLEITLKNNLDFYPCHTVKLVKILALFKPLHESEK